jgi:hypothetical protein
MMAPHVYEEARANAPIHVQLWRPRGGETLPRGASVRTTAWVIRIFRDRDHAVGLGRRISFDVPVMHPIGSNGPELSGTIYHDWNRLGRAHWLEAFMERSEGGLELVHSQIAAIRHPTLRPVCGPDARGFLCEGNLR